MIINITQHKATAEQIAAGVAGEPLCPKLLNFDAIPDDEELIERAARIADRVPASATQAMIGGAPFFMSALEQALLNIGVEPIYAFSRRESVEIHQLDGSVEKQNVFRHLGFVRPQQ